MIPNYLADVEQAMRDYPGSWRNAHTGNAQTEDFIRLLAARLHAKDPRFGLNGKRGNPNDISDDALNFRGEGPGHDPTNGNAPITVIDVIGGAGGPDPRPLWQVFSELPGPGAWVQPTAPASSTAPPPPPVAPPAPVPAPAPVDLTPVLHHLAQLVAEVRTLSEQLDRLHAVVTAPAPPPPVAPTYSGRVLGQTITLRPSR